MKLILRLQECTVAQRKKPSKPNLNVRPPAKRQTGSLVPGGRKSEFAEVVSLIEAARQRAFAAVNHDLVELYWKVGEYISRKLETSAWGESVVEQLAEHIAKKHPNLKGFTRASLFRMRQFYGTYQGHEKVAPLVRQLPWSHHLLILSRAKHPEPLLFNITVSERRP